MKRSFYTGNPVFLVKGIALPDFFQNAVHNLILLPISDVNPLILFGSQAPPKLRRRYFIPVYSFIRLALKTGTADFYCQKYNNTFYKITQVLAGQGFIFTAAVTSYPIPTNVKASAQQKINRTTMRFK